MGEICLRTTSMENSKASIELLIAGLKSASLDEIKNMLFELFQRPTDSFRSFYQGSDWSKVFPDAPKQVDNSDAGNVSDEYEREWLVRTKQMELESEIRDMVLRHVLQTVENRHPEVFNERDFMAKMIHARQGPNVIPFLSDEIRNDDEFLLENKISL